MKRAAMMCGLVGIVGMLLIPTQEAQARADVSCTFGWREHKNLNVKGGGVTVNKSVRNKEYDRLVRAGVVGARVSAARGARCQLNHPENSTIDAHIEKAAWRLDRRGKIPDCADFRATVRCVGR